MKTIAALFAAPIVALAITPGITPASAQPSGESANATQFQISGTMVHTTLEGGCWYLDATDGKHYELVGAQSVIEPLHEEGRAATLWVEPAKGQASVCMVGPIVRVVQDITQRHPVDLVIAPMRIDGRIKRTTEGIWYARTKQGARYEFKGLPPKKYRKVNARINTTLRVLLDQASTKTGAQGVILEQSRQTTKSSTKHTTKSSTGKKMIEKKNDPR